MQTTSAQLEVAESQLVERDALIAGLEADLQDTRAELQTTSAQLDIAENQLVKKDAQIEGLEADLQDTRAELQTTSAQLEVAESQLVEREAQIEGLEVALQDSRTSIQAASNQLKKRDAEIETLEGDLEDSQATVEAKSAELEENKMRPIEELEIMRVHEPMGFYVDPHDTATGVRLLTAIACVGGMPPGYEPHVYYRIHEQEFIDTLVRSGDYKKVGEAKWSSADWTSEEEDIEFFFTRKETLGSNPYEWLDDSDWVTNEMAWFETLHAYCSDTVQP